MMPLFSSKKKESSSKTVVVSTTKSVTISNNAGDTKTTVEKFYKRQASSSSHSSETVFVDSKVNKPEFLSIPSRKATLQTFMDAQPFNSKPRRSVYSSEPLTSRHANITPSRNREIPSSFAQPAQSVVNEFNDRLQISVKPSQGFYDDNNPKVPAYRTRSKNRGKLLLINNTKFINSKDIRKGAELDEANVKTLFGEFGFVITNHQNLSKVAMEKEIKRFRDNSSLKKVDIGCVVVMSHGTGHERSDSTQVLCSDGQLLETSWIVDQFNSTHCEHLNGKPKIFIFQCCRGNSQDVQYDAIPMTPQRSLSDMLLAYSTIPGYVSHRDPTNGTLYIQAVCKVFMEHAYDTDVENLLKIVDNRLSRHVSVGLRQTSSFENRGFKTCYFHPKLSE